MKMHAHAAFQGLHRSNFYITWITVLIHVDIDVFLNSDSNVSRLLLNMKGTLHKK